MNIVYKGNAEMQIFSKETLKLYLQNGWSLEKEIKPTTTKAKEYDKSKNRPSIKK